jgi:hypothetical protein
MNVAIPDDLTLPDERSEEGGGDFVNTTYNSVIVAKVRDQICV